MPTPKSLQEHVTYLHEIVRLKLWFVWHWLRTHPEEEFASVLRNRVDIYRKLDINPEGLNPKTPMWEDPRWLELVAAASRAYQTHREDAKAFEEAAFAVFQPGLDTRAPRDFADRSALAAYTYGSIRFDRPKTDKPARVAIHIANAIAPRSIFDDPAYLPSCLLTVMDRAERETGATEMNTGTWLNSHPSWLAIFPAEWQANMTPPVLEIQWHYGFWGQFITARGTFHADRARRFRETGELPYKLRGSWCHFADLRRHLQEHFGACLAAPRQDATSR